MKNKMQTDCHYWDPFLRENFAKLKPKLPEIDEYAMVNSLLDHFTGTKFSTYLETMKTHNPADHNTGYRVRLLVAQVWSLCREDKDKIEIFTSQLEDMVQSRGLCEQGWTNRMIQVLFAIGIYIE